MVICCYCGGYGLPEGCPKCGKIEGELNEYSAKEIEENTQKILPYIPEKYLEEFSHNELMSGHYDLKNSSFFNNYVNFLSSTYEDLKKGILPNQSAYIYAPIGFGKAYWAYSMIKTAIELGYSAVPLFDTTEVGEMFENQLNKNKEFHFKDKVYVIDDVVNADICIIKVDVNKFTPHIISSVLDKRSRRDLTTFFVSRVSAKYISSFDDYGEFTRCLTGTNIENNKYLFDVCFNKSDKY